MPPGSVRLPPHPAARLARVGLKRGWPDVPILMPAALHGLELKRPGATLSRTRLARTRRGAPCLLAGQADVFPRLEAAGMRLAVYAGLARQLAA